MLFEVREVDTSSLKENIFFFYVILNYVKCYFCFTSWIEYILYEKNVRIFSFVYNRKYEDIMGPFGGVF